MPEPDLVYKVASRSLVEAARGTGSDFKGMPIDIQDGFVHLSTAEQLSKTLALHFAGQSDLTLLAVRAKDLGDALKWEPSRGGALFPHLYGLLPFSAIAWTAEIAVDASGHCALPEAVQ